MLIADIKGKLSIQERNSEDFLTSSVFSFFYYIGGDWLENFLRKSINEVDELRKELGIELKDPQYEFWPYYRTERSYGMGVIPDLILVYKERKVAIIIEAKNYSGKSSEENPVQINKENQQIEDQLTREYEVGLILLDKYKLDNFYLIYLTRDNIYPQDEIHNTLDEIRRKMPNELENAKNRLYWLRWQEVPSILETIISSYKHDTFEYKISLDLMKFLDRRDLIPFNGFAFLRNYQTYLIQCIGKGIFYQTEVRTYWNFIFNYVPITYYDNPPIFYHSPKLDYWNSITMELLKSLPDNIFYRRNIK